MTSPIITVRGVGKEYRLGELSNANTLRDAISAWFGGKQPTAPHSKVAQRGERIWALKDVSFDVAEGEVLGIIGANGAGKSTLLKILSRITEPTTGEIELRGRVASLLEVGTGFNDELTGRENIILNGAILGMAKREIDKKFDQIVDFSGVEKFIDTPVKHYSSGMKMRLAFAVAAHLEPEILIIDEVLAVGDAEFQRKCLGKMDEVAKAGRTVLFVSHNMAAVENLCPRAIVLASGTVVLDSTSSEAIAHYNEALSAIEVPDLADHPNRNKALPGLFESIVFMDAQRRPITSIPMGSSVIIRMNLRPRTPLSGLQIGLHFYDMRGQRITTSHTDYQRSTLSAVSGPAAIEHEIERLDFMPGAYRLVAAAATDHAMIDRIDPFCTFHVTPSDVFGTGKVPPAKDGLVILRGEWRMSVETPIPVDADTL